ncbi:MAG: tripartite tricarboxylate transporter substrate-binding protein, partial [Betaproteobacteria bacterium]
GSRVRDVNVRESDDAPSIRVRGTVSGVTSPKGDPCSARRRRIATEAVARSAADGYTLLTVAAADVVQPAMRAKLSYDLERDFAPISNVVVVPFALVTHPSVPVRNVKDLIALARARPGGLNYGSSGIGSSAHLSNELFNSMAN